jgi:hypothetical protein
MRPVFSSKKIRHQFVEYKLHVICTEDGFYFTIAAIQNLDLLSPILFTSSYESKMHNSLPLELFFTENDRGHPWKRSGWRNYDCSMVFVGYSVELA